MEHGLSTAGTRDVRPAHGPALPRGGTVTPLSSRTPTQETLGRHRYTPRRGRAISGSGGRGASAHNGLRTGIIRRFNPCSAPQAPNRAGRRALAADQFSLCRLTRGLALCNGRSAPLRSPLAKATSRGQRPRLLDLLLPANRGDRTERLAGSTSSHSPKPRESLSPGGPGPPSDADGERKRCKRVHPRSRTRCSNEAQKNCVSGADSAIVASAANPGRCYGAPRNRDKPPASPDSPTSDIPAASPLGIAVVDVQCDWPDPLAVLSTAPTNRAYGPWQTSR